VPSRRLLLLAPILGCARAPRPAPVLDPPSACAVSQPTPAADTVAIMLGEPVDPGHAPLPTNDAEALIFRQLYETLVRVDCEGNTRPALAVAWRSDGAQWTFTLRRNAAFWDGSPLDATTVLEAWRSTNPATAVVGVRSEGNQLTVFFVTPEPLAHFAAPALRLIKRGPESTWPLGTGPWEPQPDASGSRLVASAARSRNPAGVLSFDLRPGADPRDLLDAAAHLLVTRDRGAIAYAAGLSGWTDVPLAWDRVYLLLSPASASSDPAGVAPIRVALARDALRGEGRPADSTLAPWIAACTGASHGGPPPGASVGRRRVIYPREDAVARALAERLVARAESDLSTLLGFPAVAVGTTVTAVGLGPEPFGQALAQREDLAVVIPVFPYRAFDCGPLAALADGWGLVEPLVETRAHALVRAGAARVVNDRDGLVIEPAGPRR